MKNKKLFEKIDTFYDLSLSMPLKKIAESNIFDKAELKIQPMIPTVWVKNKRVIKKDEPSGRGQVSQFMVVSTTAHKPDGWGIISDDALVFIFLDQEYYLDESEFPNDSQRVSIAQYYISRAGLNPNQYVTTIIGKSKVTDLKETRNHAYSHAVAVFQKA